MPAQRPKLYMLLNFMSKKEADYASSEARATHVIKFYSNERN